MRMDKYYNQVRKIAWQFSRTTRLDFDELYCEAVFAFVRANSKYDKSRGVKPITFIHRVVTNALIDYCRKYNIKVVEEYDIEKILITSLTPYHSYRIRSMYKDLPKDCRFIIHLILNQPDKVAKKYKINWKLSRRTIGTYLRTIKWNTERITRAYTLIENELRLF